MALAVALLAAGCGTGGIVKGGDQGQGKQLFVAKCGSCHTLADAGTNGTVGPNLDDAFGSDRQQGYKDVTIQQVVRQQISLASGRMPANLVKGDGADAVSAYVAAVAGVPGKGAKLTSGKDIFVANCGSCHTLAAAGSHGQIGPSLDAALADHTRASLRAKIARPGMGSIMPQDFARRMTAGDLTALVDFLMAARRAS
jgi:mono/diheme cytochrome c family protein